MCGELAGDESAVALLVGMGLDEFSMSAISLPRIKAIVRGLSYADAQAMACKALQCATSAEVQAVLQGR